LKLGKLFNLKSIICVRFRFRNYSCTRNLQKLHTSNNSMTQSSMLSQSTIMRLTTKQTTLQYETLTKLESFVNERTTCSSLRDHANRSISQRASLQHEH